MTSVVIIPCMQRNCKHYHGILGPPDDAVYVCRAFPKGIPQEILDGQNDHTEPIEGDGGVTFEAQEAPEAEKAAIWDMTPSWRGRHL